MAAGAVIFILFTPMVSFFFNFGSVVGMTLGALLFFAGLFMHKIKSFIVKNIKKGHFKVLLFLFCILVCAVLVYSLFLIGNITAAAFFADDAPEDATVVVLGCQVRASGNPSKTLRQRLDCAYEYLLENKDAVCIVSGGKGPDEPVAEAEAMYDYLVEKGIAPERIYKEANSHNTNENMEYTAKIIEEEGFSRNIVAITNSFHQYRAARYAAHHGLTAYPENSKTDTFAYPTYLVRELFAIIKMKFITS